MHIFHMPFDIAVCLPHLVLECAQIAIDRKIIDSGSLITGGRRDRRHDDLNPLFFGLPGESAYLIHMLVTEKPVFPCQYDRANYSLVHILIEAVEFLSLVNAFLPG